MNRRDATESADDRELDEFFASRGVDMGAHRAVFASIRAAAVLTTVMEELALRPLGLSHAGYRLLCELWIKGPLELRSLAGFMMVSRPSIVGTVHTLESAGLVGRTRSEVDRRLVTIAITGSGLELVERADASWHRCQVEVTRTLSEGQKAGLADLNDHLFRAALNLRRRS